MGTNLLEIKKRGCKADKHHKLFLSESIYLCEGQEGSSSSHYENYMSSR